MRGRCSPRLSFAIAVALLLLLAFALLLASETRLVAATPYDYAWMDDFGSSSLHPLWSWVREDATNWSLTDRPGFMRITTQTGGVFGPGGDQKNLLLTEAPSGDFRITTKVTITPTENFRFAALQVYQDDDNYIQINRAYANGDTLNFDLEVGGVVTSTQIVESATTLYLRVVKEGNNYSGYYSTNGTDWTEVGQHAAALASPKVGIGAANNLSGVSEVPADFDFFEVAANYQKVFLPVVLKNY